MYGTVARMRVKPGMEDAVMRLAEMEDAVGIPGMIAQYVYRMDADPNVYYLAVVFESKAAYFANAESPEQHARYLDMLALLEGEPEWNDGEIVYPRA
ncbi:MAG: antibiotic biosynthesis monooxygenase [Anaerolineae bacterium]|nr:antibiotic biosynthesis monooxygenase [Anaerolineae bacterium]